MNKQKESETGRREGEMGGLLLQNVKELSLVLVNSLDVNIEKCINRHIHSANVTNIVGKADLNKKR